jgi:hypothetical protein
MTRYRDRPPIGVSPSVFQAAARAAFSSRTFLLPDGRDNLAARAVIAEQREAGHGAGGSGDLGRIIERLDERGRLVRVTSEIDPVHDLAGVAAKLEGRGGAVRAGQGP